MIPPLGVPALLAGLVDDAALFPPGNAPMAVAVRDHIRHRQAWYANFVGPFVCSDVHLGDLAAEVQRLPADTQPLRVSLVLPDGAESMAAVVEVVAGTDRLQLAAVEVRLAPDPDLVDAARDVLASMQAARLPVDCVRYIEVPPDATHDVIPVISLGDARAKLRTGGVEAAAFPSERTVAGFIRTCVDEQVRFKCTAGLHHAVRHTAPDTGFEHHGFLNVIAAVERAAGGATIGELTGILGERDRGVVVAMVADIGQGGGRRRWFDSFGSCSVAEPLAELITAGMVSDPHATRSASAS